MSVLTDRFGRRIDYLRVSVTDRCNLRCVYCMPPGGIFHKGQSEILSFEDISRIVDVAADLGVRKVRLTGGEPLVRKDVPLLVKTLRNIKKLKEIALTTNGTYLADLAPRLKEAGLDRVNVSLDTLIPERFSRITRGGDIGPVLKGLEAASLEGLTPLKVNVVLMKGLNDDEIPDFANLAKDRDIHVRFIEYMPARSIHAFHKNHFLSAAEAKKVCQGLGELEGISDFVGNEGAATASVFRIKGFCGTISFISPMSEPFCFSCNKLRLTSDGYLKGCLHSSGGVNLKEAIERGCSDEDLAFLIREAVYLKPESHNLSNEPLGVDSKDFSMCQIGG